MFDKSRRGKRKRNGGEIRCGENDGILMKSLAYNIKKEELVVPFSGYRAFRVILI